MGIRALGSYIAELSDYSKACAEIVYEGQEAVVLILALGTMQVSLENYNLVMQFRKIVFLPMKLKSCAVSEPREGDIVIGSLCGRTAIIPREMRTEPWA